MWCASFIYRLYYVTNVFHLIKFWCTWSFEKFFEILYSLTLSPINPRTIFTFTSFIPSHFTSAAKYRSENFLGLISTLLPSKRIYLWNALCKRVDSYMTKQETIKILNNLMTLCTHFLRREETFYFTFLKFRVALRIIGADDGKKLPSPFHVRVLLLPR